MQAVQTDRAPPVTINKTFINGITFPTSEEGRRVHWDKQLKGFGVRVNPNGSVVFVVQYRMKTKGAKTQTITIGKYASPWSPDAAREKARALLEQIHHGIDPIAAKREAEEAEQQASLEESHYDFDAFGDRYIERHVKASGLRSLKDIEGTFDRDLRPFFKGKSRFSTGSSNRATSSTRRWRRSKSPSPRTVASAFCRSARSSWSGSRSTSSTSRSAPSTDC